MPPSPTIPRTHLPPSLITSRPACHSPRHSPTHDLHYPCSPSTQPSIISYVCAHLAIARPYAATSLLIALTGHLPRRKDLAPWHYILPPRPPWPNHPPRPRELSAKRRCRGRCPTSLPPLPPIRAVAVLRQFRSLPRLLLTFAAPMPSSRESCGILRHARSIASARCLYPCTSCGILWHARSIASALPPNHREFCGILWHA